MRMEARVKKLELLRKWSYAERWIWFAVGVFVNAFGIALITTAALGTSPISSVPFVLSLEFPLSFGVCTFVLNMLFIILQKVLLGPDFKPFQWLQVAVDLLFSASIDVSMTLLQWLDPTTIPEMVAVLLLGCVLLGCGISIEVAPNVLIVPGEGAVKAISVRLHKLFGTCKVAFDLSLVVIACVLSFAFFGYLNGLGVGTVVSALVVGNVVNFSNKHFPLVRYILGVSVRGERLRHAILREKRHEQYKAGRSDAGEPRKATPVEPLAVAAR